MTKVILDKQYNDETIRHKIILGKTPVSCKDCDNNPVIGKVIGVSIIDNETRILIGASNDRIYNRRIDDVQINGKFERV